MSSQSSIGKFKSDTGRGRKVAEYHGKNFELHSKGKIPSEIRDWLDEKDIDYVEHED